MESGSPEIRPPAAHRLRWVALVTAVALIGLAYWQLREVVTFQFLAEREAELRKLQRAYPAAVYTVAFVLYVVVTGASLPGATVLTLAYGWFFGWLRGLALVSFASTSGATVAFLLSRYFFRQAIQQRFGERLRRFNDSLEREGPFFLFLVRLIPVFPFFVVNAVMGLTPIATRTFWWVSQLGMLPATAVYLYAGSSVPSLKLLAAEGVRAVFTPAQLAQLAIAFGLLGLLPLTLRWLLKGRLT